MPNVTKEPPNIGRMTRHELSAAIKATGEAIDQLRDRAGSDLKGLTDAQVEELGGLIDYGNELQDEFARRPDPREALKSKVAGLGGGSHSAVRRPPLGGGHAASYAGSGALPGGGDDANRIDPGESEHDKFVRKGPFKSLGHLAYEVQRAGDRPGLADRGALGEWNQGIARFDDAIKSMPDDYKSITGMSEFADPDGAAMVPTTFAAGVWERAMAVPNLLTYCSQIPVSGNGYSMAAWQDHSRSTGYLYGGAKAFWTDEAAHLTGTKPKTRNINWKLNKLTVLMYATDELLADAVALDAQLSRVAANSFAFKINDAMINGTGNGQPEGLLNSPCKITAGAVSGQGNGTVVAQNADEMFARRAPATTDWVWLYNVSCEPQFDQFRYTATNSTTGVAATWAYVPAGLNGGPAMLKGQKTLELEHCQAVGTEGDLILWSPSSYGVIVKSTGINQAVSMHLRFDYGETAFRWSFRMDGRSYWDQPLTPANGPTRSPIITLNSSRS